MSPPLENACTQRTPIANTDTDTEADAVTSRLCRLCTKAGMDVTEATFDLAGDAHQLFDAYRTFACLTNDDLHLDALRICFACTGELVAAFTFLAKVSAAEQLLMDNTMLMSGSSPRDRKHSDCDYAAEVAEGESELPASADDDDDANDFEDAQQLSEEVEAETETIADHDKIDHDEGNIDYDADHPDIAQHDDAANVYHDHHIEDGISHEVHNTSSGDYEVIEYIEDDDDDEEDEGSAELHDDASLQPSATTAATKRAKRAATAAAANHAVKRDRKASRDPSHIQVDLHYVLVPQFLISVVDPATRPDIIPPAGVPANRFGVQPTIKTLDVSVRRCSDFGPAGLQLLNACANQADHPYTTNSVYMCTYCPKAFTTAAHLLVHTRKNHVCQFCLRSFAHVADMHLHIRQRHHHSHLNCPLCVRYFNGNSNLRNHMRSAHDLNLPPGWSLLTEAELDTTVARMWEEETIVDHLGDMVQDEDRVDELYQQDEENDE